MAARRLAQIAFSLAESLALVAALILPLGFLPTGLAAVPPLIFAQRALAAAEILALAAALILNFFFLNTVATRRSHRRTQQLAKLFFQ